MHRAFGVARCARAATGLSRARPRDPLERARELPPDAAHGAKIKRNKEARIRVTLAQKKSNDLKTLQPLASNFQSFLVLQTFVENLWK